MNNHQLDALTPVSEELFAKIRPIIEPFVMKHTQIGIHRGQWPGMDKFKMGGMTEEEDKAFREAADQWVQAGRPLCLVAAECYEDLVLVYDCGHGHCLLVDLTTKAVQATNQPGFVFLIRNLVVIDKFQHEPQLKSSFFVSTHSPASEAFVEEWRPSQHDDSPSGNVALVSSSVH